MNEETNNARSDRILVVDDTTANLQLLTNLLTERGYTFYPASDGELALEFVHTTLSDLILLDIRMPGMMQVVSVQKLAEEVLNQLNDELKQRVKQRIAELEENLRRPGAADGGVEGEDQRAGRYGTGRGKVRKCDVILSSR